MGGVIIPKYVVLRYAQNSLIWLLGSSEQARGQTTSQASQRSGCLAYSKYLVVICLAWTPQTYHMDKLIVLYDYVVGVNTNGYLITI